MLCFTSPLSKTRVPARLTIRHTLRGSFHTGAALRSSSALRFVDVGPAQLDSIKCERFATKMSEFKEVFEKPCVDAFSAIFELKRKVVNKKAKYMSTVGKKAKKLPPSKLERLEAALKHDQKQEEALHKKIQSLRTTRVDYRCMKGRTPKERKEREALFKRLMTQDQNSTRSRFLAAEEEGRWQQNPGAPASDGELGLAIAKELEMANLPVKWDLFMKKLQNKYLRDSHDLVNKNSFIAQAWASLPESQLTLVNVDPDRPVVLKSPPHDPRPKKLPRTIINKVSNERPIGFETNHYPGTVFDPMRTRKVTMYVKVSQLNLPRAVRERLLELAGAEAYEPGKDLLTLKTQKKRTFRENRALVAERFRRMLAEAWKADLNYLPSADPALAPHDLIEEEMKQAAEKAERDYNDSFESILDAAKEFSVFRLPVVPPTDTNAHQVNVLLKEMNSLSQ